MKFLRQGCGLPLSKLVVGGFSQGAMTAVDLALQLPAATPPGGIVRHACFMLRLCCVIVRSSGADLIGNFVMIVIMQIQWALLRVNRNKMALSGAPIVVDEWATKLYVGRGASVATV
eukprot:SAG31_NODE_4928_length_2857_cov_1.877810_1_plen_117_part_00